MDDRPKLLVGATEVDRGDLGGLFEVLVPLVLKHTMVRAAGARDA